MQVFDPLHPIRAKRLAWYIKQLSPVAYYSLTERSGNAVNKAPSTFSSLSGTVTEAIQGRDGLMGKAYSFDGSNDEISVGTNAAFSVSTGITLLAFVNLDEDITVEKGIVSLTNVGDSKYNLIVRGDASNVGRIELNLAGGIGYQSVSGTTSLNAGTWYMVAGTYDKENIRFYLNGTEEGTANAQTEDITTDTWGLLMGMHTNVAERHWDGLIQHVAIFGSALTADQLAKIARIAGL